MNRNDATAYYTAKLADLYQLEYDFKIHKSYNISIQTHTTATSSYFEGDRLLFRDRPYPR